MMTATQTRGADEARADGSGAFSRSRSRTAWVHLALPVVAILLVWLLPAIGLVAFAVMFVLLVPLGTFLQDRLAIGNILALTGVTVLLGLIEVPISLASLQWAVTATAFVLVVWEVVRPGTLRLPSFEPATAIVLGAIVVLLAAMALPFVGASPGQVLSGLLDGWDHSTHFSLFVGSYDQAVVEFLTDEGVPAMGVTYPSVPVWLWAAAAPAYVGTAASPADLLVPYVFFSAIAAALSLGVLAAVAADMSRRLSTLRITGAAAGALVMGVMSLVGTATLFQDQGHVNYLMAVTVAVSGSWYAVASFVDGKRALAVVIVAAAGLVTAFMYPPLVLGVGLAGAWVLWHLFDSRPRVRWVVLVVAAAVVVVAVALRRSVLDAAMAQIDSLVPLTGGLQPFDVMVVVISPVVAAILVRIAYRKGVGAFAVGLLGAWAGLSAAVALFAWRTLQLGVDLADSYYTVKLLLGVWVVASLLLAVLIAVWFTGYLGSASAVGEPFHGWWRSLAWAGLIAVVGASAGYFGPKPSGLPAETPVSPGLQAFLRRGDLVNTLPDGDAIVAASDALRTFGTQPILWDGGDLKGNHYLMAMDGYVDNDERALVSSFPTPYGAEAAALLAEDLRVHPDHSVQIAYRSPESRAVLRKLRQEFPDQVTLVQVP